MTRAARIIWGVLYLLPPTTRAQSLVCLNSAHGGLKTEFPDIAAELEVLPERFSSEKLEIGDLWYVREVFVRE